MRTQTNSQRLRGVKSHGATDNGFTLIEVMISLIIAGALVTTMTFAYSTFLRTYPQTVNRVAVSKDVTFVQAWLPIDLASALDVDADPVAQPASVPLAGTNVMVIERIDLQDPAHPVFLVNYRYQQIEGEWVLVRYEIRNPGATDGTEEVREVGVAHELATPPLNADGSLAWDPNTAPTFAIDVKGRNPGRLRKVGNDITVTFADGTTYDTGGAGLGPGNTLPAVSSDGFVNPTSPPSRCGGRMTLLLDTSSSLAAAEFVQVKTAAQRFVDSFQGTPTLLRVIEFDEYARPVAPANFSDPAVDMLNQTEAQVNAINATIAALPDQSYAKTNWEDALRRAITDYSDTDALIKMSAAEIPDTVVFFTDGLASRYTTSDFSDRSSNWPSGSSSSQIPALAPASSTTNYWSNFLPDESLAQAKEVSNKKGEWGVSFKGVYISSDQSEQAKNNVKDVVGNTEWSAPSGGVGNADAASFFATNDFDELANIFQQIFASDCGGTVTVQRRKASAPSTPLSTGSYEFSTSTGTGTLKAAETSSITFDYDLGSGASEQVPLIEPGATSVDIDCYLNGQLVNDRVDPLTEDDGTNVPNGRLITVNANQALSCIVIGD